MKQKGFHRADVLRAAYLDHVPRLGDAEFQLDGGKDPLQSRTLVQINSLRDEAKCDWPSTTFRDCLWLPKTELSSHRIGNVLLNYFHHAPESPKGELAEMEDSRIR